MITSVKLRRSFTVDKKVLAVVPARGGSKGVKLKNLRSVGGVSLIGHVGCVLKDVPEIHTAIISSDHSGIIIEGLKAGLEAPFVRPEELSGDRVSDIEVLTHALLEVERLKGECFDIVLMLQPTSPMRRPDDIKDTLYKLVDGGYDSVFTVSETDSKGHPLKQYILNGDNISLYDDAGAKIIARQELAPVFHKNGLTYALTRQCLLEQKTLLGNKSSFIVTQRPVINIDIEHDIDLAEFFISRDRFL